MFPTVLSAPESSALPLALQGDQRQAWQALADAAKALYAVASALAGQTVSSGPNPPTILTPSPHLFPARPGEGDRGEEITVSELVNDVLTAKAKRGLSEAYLRRLRVTLGAFVRGRSRKPLRHVTTAEIEAYIEAQAWQPRTKQGVIEDLRMLFATAQKRGYLASNPAAPIEAPAAPDKAPGIHTPAQVKAVLRLAYEHSDALGRIMAIRYFAGLRTAEALRLAEEDILTDRGYIEVKASKSKTRRRRLVKIQPALAAFLALGGELPLPNANTRFAALGAKMAGEGIPRHDNATRHSFVSYHLAHFGKAGRTALEAGHTEEMVFAHYRALVTEEDARAFWRIRPPIPSIQT